MKSPFRSRQRDHLSQESWQPGHWALCLEYRGTLPERRVAGTVGSATPAITHGRLANTPTEQFKEKETEARGGNVTPQRSHG